MYTDYYHAHLHRMPTVPEPFKGWTRDLWHYFASVASVLGLWYLYWRWAYALNADAITFSVVVAAAETLSFIGTLLFFYDVWDEKDTIWHTPPKRRADVGLSGDAQIHVDVFVTTFNEDASLVKNSIRAAKKLELPGNTSCCVCLLDDGDRSELADLAAREDVKYLSRKSNRGFKAGNLQNALFETDGDFFVICDADTLLQPEFLMQTLGYFRNPKVAWVQTPHWFYDLPLGRHWRDVLPKRLSWLAKFMTMATGKERFGEDVFMSDPQLFFDVIQRRRNRNNASFCCGAGSVHRREAVFDSAIEVFSQRLRTSDYCRLPRLDLQPFKFHVSEDIFTSILQHQNGWQSVYHPVPLARMLSPWTNVAWATQRLKYAGGTFDILFHHNPLLKAGLPLSMRLHYLATFWSYISIFWMPVLLFAPVYSLFSGKAPVDAYSVEFFAHFVPAAIACEVAILIGAKGNDPHKGRILTLATLWLQWRAAYQVIVGQKPSFPPTPKIAGARCRYAVSYPVLLMLLVMCLAGLWAGLGTFFDLITYPPEFLYVNALWLTWNGFSLIRAAHVTLGSPRNYGQRSIS